MFAFAFALSARAVFVFAFAFTLVARAVFVFASSVFALAAVRRVVRRRCSCSFLCASLGPFTHRTDRFPRAANVCVISK